MTQYKVSIIMATYNGQKYVLQQLDSLRKQSQQADEVIICDDCSTDNTFSFIQNYVKTNGLKHWKVERNSKNIGWKQTFWHLLHEAKHEFVFLSDQDDIWAQHKISAMSAIMFSHKKIQLLASDFIPFQKNDIHFVLTNPSNFELNSKIIQLTFDSNFLNVSRPGCSFLIRKSLVLNADKYWSKEQPHDFTLWNTSLLNDSAYLLNLPLVYWRVHNDSADFSQKYSKSEILLHPKRVYQNEFAKKKAYLNFNLIFLNNSIKEKINKNLSEIIVKRDFLELRTQYLVQHKLVLFLRSLLKFRRHYNLKMIFSDVYFIFCSKIF